MIDRLTFEQINLLKERKRFWHNNSESLAFDEMKVIRFVNILYQIAGLQKPAIKILNGPNDHLDSCRINLKTDLAEHPLYTQEINRSQRWSKVIYKDIFEKIVELRSTDEKCIKEELFSFLMSIESQIKEKVSMKLFKKVNDLFYNKDYTYPLFPFDPNWIAVYDFFEYIGVIKNDLLKDLIDSLKYKIFCLTMFDDLCLITLPPISVNRDENGRLHSVKGPGIKFRDGYEDYLVHNVTFSEEEFFRYVKNENISGDRIFFIKEVDKRVVLVKLYGYKKIMNSRLLNTKTLDIYEKVSQITGKMTRSELLEFKLDKKICRVLKVEDHSVHKITFLGVPRNKQTCTCLGSIAWTFGLKIKDYKPLMES